MNHRSVLLLPLVLLPALASCASIQEGRYGATPQRPRVSQNTRTTAFGTFELEGGVAWDHEDRFETPARLKYGATESTELSIGWSPLLVVQDPTGHDESGVGDVRLGIRHRMWDEHRGQPAIGVLAEVKLPAADEDDGLGTGFIDAGFGAIASREVQDALVTGFYRLDFLGQPADNTDVGHTLAVAAEVGVADTPFGVFGEVSGTFLPEDSEEFGLLLLGGTYTPYPAVVFDVAAATGLTSESPDFVVLAGFTTNFGLWQPPVSRRGLTQ